MDFTIYQISDDEFQTDKIHLSEDQIVEQGLSSGELRQSILDRFREEVKNKKLLVINGNLQNYGLSILEDFLETSKKRELVIKDIDKLLYSLSDEDLNKSLWVFSEEIIYISGEE